MSIALLLVSLFLKGKAVEYEMPEGYDWKTRGGQLFIYAGHPPRFLSAPLETSWKENTWLVHDKPKPANVEIIPLNSEIKQLIVNEVNNRRAKTLLGAYFDPERAREWGVVPPAAELSTVKYDENIARTVERYIQHFEYHHYHLNSFYPHERMEDVLSMQHLLQSPSFTTQDEIRDNIDVIEAVLTGIKDWFDEEMPYYKHYEPYRYRELKEEVKRLFRDPVENDQTLTKVGKKQKLLHVLFGHFATMVQKNIYSMGCALAWRDQSIIEDIRNDGYYSIYFACYFGGDLPMGGQPIFDMDESFLQRHGLSKSDFAP